MGGLVSWYLGVWKQYATFTGRARRKEYWFFYLFNTLALFVLALLDGVLVGILMGLAGSDDPSGVSPLYTIYALVALIPTIAVGIRRMHDTDHRGWWLLVPIASLVLLIMPGTDGPNRFGPDQKGSLLDGTGALIAPPGWYSDPSGEHRLRYWDSRVWTHRVSDAPEGESRPWDPFGDEA